MKPHILVPLDGSTLAERALPHAVALARLTSSAITLLRAAPPPVLVEPMVGAVAPSATMWEIWEEELSMSRNYLANVAKRLQEQGLEAWTELIEDPPATAIVNYAAQNPSVSLIVMVTHGRSGLKRWVFGSVAEKVLHAATKPVLMIRPKEQEGEAAEQTPIEPVYDTILVPLDGSRFAEQALDEARGLAAATRAILVLVAAVPSPDDWQVAQGEFIPVWAKDAQKAEVAQLTAYLANTAERLRAEGLKVKTELVHGHPAEMILQAADRLHADLIVMATHGRSGLQRLWLGSTAQKVVQGAISPVLLVRAKEPHDQPAIHHSEEQRLVSAGGTSTIFGHNHSRKL